MSDNLKVIERFCDIAESLGFDVKRGHSQEFAYENTQQAFSLFASQQAAHEAEIARLKEEMEPLRAQVAMLREGLDEHWMTSAEGICAISNTQATAEQFIAECEQRGAVKVLEEVISAHDSLRLDDDMLWLANSIRAMADARRATSKKAG